MLTMGMRTSWVIQGGGSHSFPPVSGKNFGKAMWIVVWTMTGLFMAGCAVTETDAPTAGPNTIAPAATQSIQTTAPETPSNWKTYSNPKYGYEIQIPLNWFTDRSDYVSQSYTPQRSPFCGGGGGRGVWIRVYDNPDNFSAREYLQNKMNSNPREYEQVDILGDRMGFAQGLDVVVSVGYMGAGSPGPAADINTGRGQIIEIRTETREFPAETIFSTFRLTDSNPDLQEFKVDIFNTNRESQIYGDIGIIRGDQISVITDWGQNYEPLLSPDKTRVAYLSVSRESVSAGNMEPGGSSTSNNVWIINVDGSGPIQVTTTVDRVFRDNLHWLDNGRLMYSDGKSAIKIYSLDTATTLTALGSEQPVPNPRGIPLPFFLYNSDFSYVLRFEDLNGNSYAPIAILELSTLRVTMVSDAIFPITCALEFGPDNTTFLGQKEYGMNSEPATLDLRTGKVSYSSTP